MSRFTHGVVLPPPPVVSQKAALLPDGSIDPAALTDCGEACLSAALRVATSYTLSPGCIRQMLGEPRDNGRTLGHELSGALNALGVQAWELRENASFIWDALARSRHHGRYTAILGYWLAFPSLHWVLAYQRDSIGVWVMDPWNADLRYISEGAVRTAYANSAVVINLWS